MIKYFTEKQVGAAAIIGGPIPPGILFFLNYKRIGKEKEAYYALAVTLIFTVALFYTVLSLPEDIIDKVPNAVFTAIYGILVYLAYRQFLAQEIDHKISEGAETSSNWAVVGYVVLGLVINIGIILAMSLSMPPFEGEKLTFGAVGNEIYFDESTTSTSDVIALSDMLTESGFFADEFAVAVHLETTREDYIITFPIQESYWTDSEVMSFFETVKSDMALTYRKNVIVVLESYDLSGTRHELRL